jgi:hypothetical protein
MRARVRPAVPAGGPSARPGATLACAVVGVAAWLPPRRHSRRASGPAWGVISGGRAAAARTGRGPVSIWPGPRLGFGRRGDRPGGRWRDNIGGPARPGCRFAGGPGGSRPDSGGPAVADRLPCLGRGHIRRRVADRQHGVTRLGARAEVVVPGTRWRIADRSGLPVWLGMRQASRRLSGLRQRAARATRTALRAAITGIGLVLASRDRAFALRACLAAARKGARLIRAGLVSVGPDALRQACPRTRLASRAEAAVPRRELAWRIHRRRLAGYRRVAPDRSFAGRATRGRSVPGTARPARSGIGDRAVCLLGATGVISRCKQPGAGTGVARAADARSPARVAPARRSASAGSLASAGTVPTAGGVAAPATPTGAALVCTIAGRGTHAVERSAPRRQVRLVWGFPLRPGVCLPAYGGPGRLAGRAPGWLG